MKIGKPTRKICDLKEGDFITIKPLERMSVSSTEYIDNETKKFYLYSFVEEMRHLCGQTYEISHILRSNNPTDVLIQVKGLDFSISPSMCIDFSDKDPLMRYQE